jgi:hypothetical protein
LVTPVAQVSTLLPWTSTSPVEFAAKTFVILYAMALAGVAVASIATIVRERMAIKVVIERCHWVGRGIMNVLLSTPF